MITVGTDSELFFMSGGKTASAIGTIGGDKCNPVWVGDDFNIQEDNVLGEFAIAHCVDSVQWCSRIDSAISWLGGIAEANGMNAAILSSSVLEDKWLQSPMAKEFGCTPDWCVYDGTMKRPSPNGNLRTAGGHIHVGYECDFSIESDVVRWMDIHMGLVSVVLDDDKLRRSLYGQAGSYRPKPYGLEYRVLSNFWLKSKDTIEWAFHTAKACVEIAIDGEAPVDDMVPVAINNSDVGLASSLIKKYGVIMP